MELVSRRTLIKTGAATLAASHAGRALASRAERVVVVGAGIMGASIAYQLARRGANVTILEKTEPAAGATRNSFAWINAYLKEPLAYFQLNMAGVLDWRRLALEIGPDLQVQWGGSVQWATTTDDADKLTRQVHQRAQFGDAMRLIEADQLHALLPGVVPGPFVAAAFSDLEATLDPVQATRALLVHAQKHGAKLVCPCEVTALQVGAGRIDGIVTSQGTIKADHYVLAAGVGTAELAQQAGVPVPLIDKPGILTHSKPMSRIVDRVVVLPVGLGLGLKQNPDGRIVTGGHFGNNGDQLPTEKLGRRMLDGAARYLPGLKDARIDFMTVGHSVMPEDGLPIVGTDPKHRNLFVAAMDSGVTLSALIGRLAVAELIDGVPTEMLEPYRPSRFSAA